MSEDLVKRCKKCGEFGLYTLNYNVHKNCGGELELVNFSYEEICALDEITHDHDFFQAMLELKEKDLIDYNLKMSQFKTQLAQQKNVQPKKNTYPRCPTCGSTSMRQISDLSKAANTVMWGVLGTKRYKTFHCNTCGYEW